MIGQLANTENRHLSKPLSLRSGTICIAAAIVMLLTQGCRTVNDAQYFRTLDRELRSRIMDPNVEDEILLESISRLGKITESPEFWKQIANDPRFSLSHRRRCVFALFRRHGRGCTNIKDLGEMVLPAKWLQEEHIDTVTVLTGLIPVDWSPPDDTVFSIDVLPDTAIKSQIYLRVVGHLNRDDLYRAFTTPGAVNLKDAEGLILELGYSDDYNTWFVRGGGSKQNESVR